ncbi:MAG: hypothetical protein J5965_26170 [Aeriscardovia sp.]|nr:hypothetical protein [Aeriscardovia sp.]
MDKNSIKCGLEDTLTLLHDIRRLDSVFIGSPFYVHLLSASYAIRSALSHLSDLKEDED